MSTKDIFIEILEGRIRDLNEAGKALVDAIEKIRAEILRLKDKGKYHEDYDCAYRDGNNDVCGNLLAFLDTLEAEQPSLPAGLEEAALLVKEWERYMREKDWLNKDQIDPAELSKHFFEFGKQVGAKWRAEQGGSIECEVDWIDGPFLNFTEEQLYHVLVEKGIASGDKVIVQIRKK